MPLISVIVPVYNVEKYIHLCVDSILAQTFTDFELILVDDGSPDNCGAICDSYASGDYRIKVLHLENGGVSRARNAALDIAKGKYIAFCDSDDSWKPDFLEQMVSAMEAKDADCVVCNFQMEDECGNLGSASQHEEGTWETVTEQDKCDFMIQKVLSGKVGWEIWTRIFRRDIIQNQNIRFCTTCGNYAEDLGFVLQYALFAKKQRSIDYSGYNYLLRENSMMRSVGRQPKLNEMNEVSAHVGCSFSKAMKDEKVLKLYPVIHFLMMRVEYQKLVDTHEYPLLAKKLKCINNKSWYEHQTKKLPRCQKYLRETFGKNASRMILLLSRYCIHGKWICYRCQRAIAIRLLRAYKRKQITN